MKDDRKIKSVTLGIMDVKGRNGRPSREQTDDIKELCKQDLCMYSIQLGHKNEDCRNI